MYSILLKVMISAFLRLDDISQQSSVGVNVTLVYGNTPVSIGGVVWTVDNSKNITSIPSVSKR